jgi:tRNA (mo5U34)-methyltransferase
MVWNASAMALRDVLRRRANRTPSPELQRELDAPPAWMYPFDLGDGIVPPLLHHELPSVHETRASMMEPIVRQALANGGTAIDVACSEGWFAHRLLDWGASDVLGVDVRDVNVRRARLVQDHYDIASEKLRFDVADAMELGAERTGTFDVVVMIGLIYHLENPIGALRIARGLCRGLCVVEAQVTEQHEPIRSGVGVTDAYEELEASWAAKFEPAQDFHPIASHGGVISLVPNLAALVQAMEVVGFRDVRVVEAAPHLNRQYVQGQRRMVVGYA